MITVCILSFIYSCALNVSLKTRCYNWLHVAIDGVTSTYHLFCFTIHECNTHLFTVAAILFSLLTSSTFKCVQSNLNFSD